MVAIDDISQGCYKFLLSKADVVASVGSEDSVPFIFNGNLYTTIQGKNAVTAIVITSAGGWGGPNTGNTAEFPRIGIEVWSDPPRDALGNVTQPIEARTQAFATYHILDRYMHRPYGSAVYFGTVLTFSCVRLGEPLWVQNNTDDKVGKLTVYYGVSCITSWTNPPD